MGPMALIIPVLVVLAMLAPVVAVLSLCELVGKLWRIRFPSAFARPAPVLVPGPCRLERWLQRRVDGTKP